MVVCVECLPADKPWDVVSVTRQSSGVAPRACVRVYARVLGVPEGLLSVPTFQGSQNHVANRANRRAPGPRGEHARVPAANTCSKHLPLQVPG